MTIKITNKEGDRGLPASPGQTVARIGVCSGGTANAVHSFEPGDERQVSNEIGYGPLATATTRSLVLDGAVRCLAVKAAASILGSIGAITKTGSGPSITAQALTSPSTGPWVDLNVKLTITEGGALGTARALVAVDGTTAAYAIDLLAEKPATLRGTVDLTTITVGALDTLTFDMADVDGANPAAITFAAPVTVANVVTQVDATVGMSASLVGGKYPQLSGVTVGSGGSLVVANGTANTLLGFTNTQAANGIPSTFIIPGSGVEIVFPSGTYEKNTTYTFSLTAPRMSLSNFEAALVALRESGETFSVVVPMQAPVDAVDLAAWQLKLETVVGNPLTGWHKAAENPIYPVWLLNSPLGGTSDSDIRTNDESVRDEMAGKPAYFGAIVHGDIYLSTLEYAGLHRFPAVYAAAERCGVRRLSEDIGFGGAGDIQNASLRGPTNTKMRTEPRAVVKMKERGFIVLKDEGGAPRFVRGRTRYAAESNLVSLGVLRGVFEADRIVRFLLAQQENSDPPATPDGQIEPGLREGLKSGFDAALKSGLVDEGHFSAAFTADIVLVPNGGTDKMRVTYTLQRNTQVEDIDADLVIVRTLGG